VSALLAWDKRLRSPSLRAIGQNQSLGACYFPYEVLGAPMHRDLAELQLTDPLAVLEELANHGRCVIALPDEAHVVVYFVEPDHGRSRIVWYERRQRLVAPTAAPRWFVSLDLERAIHADAAASHDHARNAAHT
jgi:hypothetical protein